MSREANSSSCERFKKGDILELTLESGSHWGIYFGFGRVLHALRNETDGKNYVVMNTIEEFSGSAQLERNNIKDSIYFLKRGPVNENEITERVLAGLGEITSQSSREFVQYCRYGSISNKELRVMVIFSMIFGLVLYNIEWAVIVLEVIDMYEKHILVDYFILVFVLLLNFVLRHKPCEIPVKDLKAKKGLCRKYLTFDVVLEADHSETDVSQGGEVGQQKKSHRLFRKKIKPKTYTIQVDISTLDHVPDTFYNDWLVNTQKRRCRPG